MRYAYTRCVAPARASRPSLPVDESLPTWGQVRGKLYELLGNCIPADMVMRTLVRAWGCWDVAADRRCQFFPGRR